MHMPPPPGPDPARAGQTGESQTGESQTRLRGVIGHRGAPRLHRDNTLAGIAAAVRLGAAAVEADVRLTRDGVPVLHHDEVTGRLLRRVPLASLTLDQLRRRAPHVPTLAEALAALRPTGVPLVLDVGPPGSPQACLEALAADRRDGGPGHAWFCGAPGALAWLRGQDARLPLLLSWSAREDPGEQVLGGIAPQMFNPAHRCLDAAAVARWHERGIGVCAWTVDSPRRRAQLRRWGADAVISNDVARAVREWDGTAAS